MARLEFAAFYTPTPQIAKSKIKKNLRNAKESVDTQLSLKLINALSDVRADPNLYYKIRVLIYDLRHMSSDRVCENRTLRTTDVHYLSAPYFTDAEATAVKNCIVDEPGATIEQAIAHELEGFLDKREASGDFRPCGPHDLVPIYLRCFGIDKSEIEDERFVSRVRRHGINIG